MISKYILRFDDICDTIDLVLWRTIRNHMLEYNIKPILAVIPHNECDQFRQNDVNSEFWNEMKFLYEIGWTIALHGYDHVYLNNNSGILGISSKSEFAGLPYDLQKKKLYDGVHIFKEHGINPEVWVAPAHSFDKNTLSICRELGIKIVSDGLSRYPFRMYGFSWIPCQMWELREVKKPGIYTICIHLSKMDQDDVLSLCEKIKDMQDNIIGLNDLQNLNISKCNQGIAFFENKLRIIKRKMMKGMK